MTLTMTWHVQDHDWQRWEFQIARCCNVSYAPFCSYISAHVYQISWNTTNHMRDFVYCSLSIVFKEQCKTFHYTNLLWSMWCTSGAAAGVKNAFWCEIDFSTAVGHFFAPRHFSCPLENGPIRANCDKLWTSSPIHASEKKIPDHHIGKCHCQCWKMQAIRYK